MSVEFLERSDAPRLAFSQVEGKSPCVVFLGGFRSDMNGTKAEFLANHCAAHGYGYLRFDYRGHGQSDGAFEDGTIGLWARDALEMIEARASEPLILAGSSMGGWIGLLCALALKDRVKGYVGLAAAPDFTRWIRAKLSDAQQKALDEDGFFVLENDYSPEPYKITRALFEDGETHCLLDGKIAISAPVRLIQGQVDDDVPWETAEKIAGLLESQDVEIYLLPDGDHRLSRPGDLALLARLVDELIAKA